MKIMAHDNKNHCVWSVNYIEFLPNGTIKHIKGLTEMFGRKDYPIGAHTDYVNLDKILELEVIND